MSKSGERITDGLRTSKIALAERQSSGQNADLATLDLPSLPLEFEKPGYWRKK
jgi:hypothetical protein